jgi:endonuclease YncB( thermonuclease family)
MQILIAVLATGVAAIQIPSFNARVTRSDLVLVRSVIDGDTIDVATFGRVRLLGIDAPELGRGFDTPAPFASEARERLTSLILRHWVRIEQEGAALDVYNRHLAYVMTDDGMFVNATLVREGLARVSARTPLARLQELQRAEREAQAFRRGMWGAAPQIPAPGYTRPSGASRPPRSRAPRARTPSTKRRTTRKKKP